MKQKLVTVFALLLCVGLVSAAPGFWANKNVQVTGDWKWDSGWQYGNWVTATYNMQTSSQNALFGGYNEVETLGAPWKYELNSNLYVDSPGFAKVEFDAWTINDPITTPATGGYTQYRLESRNYGTFTQSSLVVKGQGHVDVDSKFNSDTEYYQDNVVRVNE